MNQLNFHESCVIKMNSLTKRHKIINHLCYSVYCDSKIVLAWRPTPYTYVNYTTVLCPTGTYWNVSPVNA